MRPLAQLFLAMILLATVSPLLAAEQGNKSIKVFASEWGITLKADGSGFYNELARLVLLDENIEADYQVVPYRRSSALFLGTPGTCRYPDSINTLTEDQHIRSGDGFLQSAALVNAHVHVFSPPGIRPPGSMEDLEGKSLAYPMGARTPIKIGTKTTEFIAVADEVSKAKMLLSGRVDLIAAALPDLKFVLDSLGHTMLPYRETLIIEELPLGLVCHSSPQTAAFMAKINARIALLKRRGDLALFYLDHGLDPHGYAPPEN